MTDRKVAVEKVAPLLQSLSERGWVVGFGGVVVQPTGHVRFFVHGTAQDLVAAIEEVGFSVPYTVEETDSNGVIFPPS
jgi:hypothetical protein